MIMVAPSVPPREAGARPRINLTSIDKEALEMQKVDMRAALGVAAFFCCGAVAAQAQNAAGFVASDRTSTLDCAGGKAEVVGSNNVLTIQGNCSGLDLAGSGNKLTIAFGAGAKISVVGSSNAILWTAADGKTPKISTVGGDNTLNPAAQSCCFAEGRSGSSRSAPAHNSRE